MAGATALAVRRPGAGAALLAASLLLGGLATAAARKPLMRQHKDSPDMDIDRDISAWAEDLRVASGERPLPSFPAFTAAAEAEAGEAADEVGAEDTPSADDAELEAGRDTDDQELGPDPGKVQAAGPGDCIWQEWAEWGACSATCATGKQSAKRVRAKKSGWTPGNGAKDCEGPSEQTKACNADVKCAEPFRTSQALGTCKVGDQVNCPDSKGKPASGTPVTCKGNSCCPSTDGSGNSFACPSAEAAWSGCNLPKAYDCLGGMAADRVKFGMTVRPDAELTPAEEIRSPPPPGSLGDDAGKTAKAKGAGTCSKSVCTKGWTPKPNLPANKPCTRVPCSEVECCDLAKSTTSARPTATVKAAAAKPSAKGVAVGASANRSAAKVVKLSVVPAANSSNISDDDLSVSDLPEEQAKSKRRATVPVAVFGLALAATFVFACCCGVACGCFLAVRVASTLVHGKKDAPGDEHEPVKAGEGEAAAAAAEPPEALKASSL